MKKTEKQYYLTLPAVGYWSEYGGIEVKEIQYGIEDYVIVVSNAWSGKRTVHRVVIHYGENPYMILHGRRHYFSECLRV